MGICVLASCQFQKRIIVAVMRMTFVIMTVVVMLRLVTVTNVVIALVVTFLGLVSG
jgi:hypothetical protein